MVAGHLRDDSTIPIKTPLMLFTIPHIVIGVTIDLICGVLWLDWTQRPRVCVALFYLTAINTTLVCYSPNQLSHTTKKLAKETYSLLLVYRSSSSV